MTHCRPFHLAIPVPDLEKAKLFYKEILGCEEGRSDDTWVDFNFFGHQLVFHLDNSRNWELNCNSVDSKQVPLPHFGVVLEFSVWEALAQKLRQKNISFEIEPYIRFKGEKGEQGTFFFRDPNGLALEFKYFQSDDSLFEY